MIQLMILQACACVDGQHFCSTYITASVDDPSRNEFIDCRQLIADLVSDDPAEQYPFYTHYWLN